ncbi:hypothetical protein NM688_g2487 [Phlebia brevispora]|uniref:Uncharacterized protein n=1 Tax=Phlebia brevispora TaxID=194682 RepID=A0ACC1T8R3_9APHY|nr:hypothetical protein NM688_g2487 [Phlebia brevispora]
MSATPSLPDSLHLCQAFSPTLNSDKCLSQAAEQSLPRRERDKALLIGCEYLNSRVPRLYGVHSEVDKFRNHLVNFQQYLEENVKVILDKDREVSPGPTCEEIYHRQMVLQYEHGGYHFKATWVDEDNRRGCGTNHNHAQPQSRALSRQRNELFETTSFIAERLDGYWENYSAPAVTGFLPPLGSGSRIGSTRREAIEWLIKDAKPGDRRVFYFAGHGYQLKARAGSRELDGKDEAILIDPQYGEPVGEGDVLIDRYNLPSDHPDMKKLRGVLVDNVRSLSTLCRQDDEYYFSQELRKLLVDPLPAGVELYTFWDSCHSGTLLGIDTDLPHYWCIRGSRFKTLSMSNFLTSNFPRRYKETAIASPKRRMLILDSACRALVAEPESYASVSRDEENPSQNESLVISISSTEDYQFSFGEGNGSMIQCLIVVLERFGRREVTFKNLMRALEKEMRRRRVMAYDTDIHRQAGRHVNDMEAITLRDIQCPLLGSRYPLDPNKLFAL